MTHRVEHVQYEPTGAIRLQVGPNKALVYVDGDYVGMVDDFDGMFQKLVLPTGRHEISIEIDGYRTHQIAVYIGEGQTLKYRADLERGEGPPTYDDLTGGEGYAGPVQTSQRQAEAPHNRASSSLAANPMRAKPRGFPQTRGACGSTSGPRTRRSTSTDTSSVRARSCDASRCRCRPGRI